ncbi:unnamed protein product [Heterosigma akashiwo]
MVTKEKWWGREEGDNPPTIPLLKIPCCTQHALTGLTATQQSIKRGLLNHHLLLLCAGCCWIKKGEQIEQYYLLVQINKKRRRLVTKWQAFINTLCSSPSIYLCPGDL